MQETIHKPIAMCKETFNHANLLSRRSGSIKETYTLQKSNKVCNTRYIHQEAFKSGKTLESDKNICRS